MYGAIIAKFDVQKLEEKSDSYYSDWIIANILGLTNSSSRAAYLDSLLAQNEVTTVNFKNYIMLLNPPDNHIDNSRIESYPYFKTVVTDTSALFGGENAYLVISGDVLYHYMNDDPYPIPEGECDIREGRYAIDDG
jgi:hypothetical protein